MKRMENFKADLTAQVFVVAAGHSNRISFAVILKDAIGKNLLECVRFLGPSSVPEAELIAVSLALQLAQNLRADKFELQLGFSSPFPEAPKPKAKVRGSSEQKKIWDLLQGFRLHRVIPHAPDQKLAEVRALANKANPLLKRDSRSRR